MIKFNNKEIKGELTTLGALLTYVTKHLHRPGSGQKFKHDLSGVPDSGLFLIHGTRFSSCFYPEVSDSAISNLLLRVLSLLFCIESRLVSLFLVIYVGNIHSRF